MKDFYSVLGVAQDANEAEIKRAYRELARRYHPDVSPTPEAEARFKEINEAYNVLSNPLTRADFDQSRRPKGAPQASPKEFRRLIAEAFGRVLVYTGIFALAGLALEFMLWWLTDSETLGLTDVVVGLGAGALTGLIWGTDQNFVVETFLGSGRAARTYTFLRTVVLALAGAYVFGRIISFGERFAGDGLAGIPTLSGATVGLILGATLGSDGETWHKLFTGAGRFELFYTMLRGMIVGVIATVVTGVFLIILRQFGVHIAEELWMLFLGFGLGMIIGSMQPPNLAAYASYASASIRTALFGLIILGVLIVGVVLGIIGRDFFAPYL